jgi:hypothetical protein
LKFVGLKNCEAAMWLDLLLILFALTPLMTTTRFHQRGSGLRGNEAGITAWEPCLQAEPEAQPHRAREV